jgi:hypothetical protein
MPMHVVGYETSASEAALTAITPIPDGVVAIQSNDIFVPKGMNNICAAAGMINSATATLRVQIVTPSLRALVPIDVSPIANGLVFGSLARGLWLGDMIYPLVELEPLDVFVQNGAAVMNRAFIHLCDGVIKPVTGRSFTVRFTTGITAVTASWVNGSLTFANTLPAGNYQVIGARCWSANGVYARFFFKGSAWRPGMPMANTEDNNEWSYFRWGNYGVWDQFNNVTPPSLDVMGITDTAQAGYLDLIKV